MKRYLLLIISLLTLHSSLFTLVSPVRAQTDWAGDCVGTTTESENVATIKGFGCLLQNVLVVVLQLLGIAMFVMLLVGGFKYLTSGGDPKATEAAQKTITAAISGLVLAILAWFILVFIKEITGVDITQFQWRLPEP